MIVQYSKVGKYSRGSYSGRSPELAVNSNKSGTSFIFYFPEQLIEILGWPLGEKAEFMFTPNFKAVYIAQTSNGNGYTLSTWRFEDADSRAELVEKKAIVPCCLKSRFKDGMFFKRAMPRHTFNYKSFKVLTPDSKEFKQIDKIVSLKNRPILYIEFPERILATEEEIQNNEPDITIE